MKDLFLKLNVNNKEEFEEKTKLKVMVEGIPATEEWEEDFNRSQSNWNTALNELKAQFAER
mgnify:CR=1 FL=1